MIPGERCWRSPFWWAAAGLLLLGVGIALSRVSLPDDRGRSVCFLRFTTGVPCPGCGMTRGLSALARRDLPQAWAYHPLAPVLVLEVGAGWVWWGLIAFRRLGLPSVRTINRLLIAHVPVLVVVWLARLLLGSVPPG